MCGITGFLDVTRSSSEEALRTIVERMAGTLTHRGPDAGGSWSSAPDGIAFGHRRLAIVDLSPTGDQPMRSPSGRFVMTYNGELYNFRELRCELQDAGIAFRGTSDTEVILGAFEYWGVKDALPRFNGMFALGVWDRRDQLLYLVRDRFGEKPLYYGWVDGAFVFASELKAMRHAPRFSPTLDPAAVSSYLRNNFIPAPASIYERVHKLSPASYVVVDARAVTPSATSGRYWSLADIVATGIDDPLETDDEEAVARLDGLLREAVRIRMVADVPLGAFLSGGVDSSTIVALMQSLSDTPVRTFTIGFHEDAFNEAQYAKKVAQHLGTDHTEDYVSARDAMNVIPVLPTLYDEPFADSSQIPTYLVARSARRHVTVALSGDAGDELFAGYRQYARGQHAWNVTKRTPHWLAGLAEGALVRTPDGLLDAGSRVIAPFARHFGVTGDLSAKVRKATRLLGARTPEDMYFILASICTDPEAFIDGEGPLRAVPHARLARGSVLDRMMYVDAVGYLPDDILVKVDRAAMGVSLETRVPLLDPRVVAFSWRLPASMKVRGGRGKWLLRQVLRRYLPAEMIDRPKQGFAVPIGDWMRGPLRPWAEDLLDEGTLRRQAVFDVGAVRRAWRRHLAGSGKGMELWGLLMFQAWWDTYMTGTD